MRFDKDGHAWSGEGFPLFHHQTMNEPGNPECHTGPVQSLFLRITVRQSGQMGSNFMANMNYKSVFADDSVVESGNYIIFYNAEQRTFFRQLYGSFLAILIIAEFTFWK